MDIRGVALQGLNRAEGQVESATRRIAQSSSTPDVTDGLRGDMVSLLSARNDFAANIGVVKTADEMEKKTLDLLA